VKNTARCSAEPEDVQGFLPDAHDSIRRNGLTLVSESKF
jgi:hypothetical protein